jgi:hypothetical protein
MAEIVNLRRVRKRAKRDEDNKRAEENRIAHGRPRAERLLQDARREQAQRRLEAHRMEGGDER